MQFPKSLSSHYLQCVNANPMARPNPSELLLSLKERGGYLSNTFISLNLKIEELQVIKLFLLFISLLFFSSLANGS